MPKRFSEWGTLLFFILICEGAGALGSLFTAGSVATWYVTLVRPSFSPPNWVFGPVWGLLYLFMAIAVFLVWKKRGEGLMLFWAQLFLNALWSPLFFGLQNPLIALFDIVLLWMLILVTTFFFFRTSRASGALMLPYLAWVSFASVLNAAIVLLN